MLYRLAADSVVVVHALFIIFTVFGGVLLLKWPRLMILHLPAAAWGVIVQVVVGGRCPLTPLENFFREKGMQPGIGESFIDHYVTSLIYIDEPPAWVHPTLGVLVFVINATVYTILFVRWRRRANEAKSRQANPPSVGIL